MRRIARIDDNQVAIVQALRQCGCSVKSLAAVGDGCPDLLVGVRGINLLLEVKDGSKPPSKRQLTQVQRVFHTEWAGQVAIVESVADAIREINGL